MNTSLAPKKADGAHWRPRAELRVLQRRAALLAAIRRYFRDTGVMEVETPLLGWRGVTDPALQNLMVTTTLPGAGIEPVTLYLQTSPEYAMKRLLAAGSGPIYQIGKAFREGEVGRQHAIEFSMLEWYRPECDLAGLMDDVGELLASVGEFPAPRRHTYRDLFARNLDVDPAHATTRMLRAAAERRVPGFPAAIARDRSALLDLLFSHVVAPTLGHEQPEFVFDYPLEHAALARIRNDAIPAAERFELFIAGVEIANGFHELADAAEQRRRFQQDNDRRCALGMPPMSLDERLLDALDAGLPDCAGVALGIDRLLTLLCKRQQIADVLSFDIWGA